MKKKALGVILSLVFLFGVILTATALNVDTNESVEVRGDHTLSDANRIKAEMTALNFFAQNTNINIENLFIEKALATYDKDELFVLIFDKNRTTHGQLIINVGNSTVVSGKIKGNQSLRIQDGKIKDISINPIEGKLSRRLIEKIDELKSTPDSKIEVLIVLSRQADMERINKGLEEKYGNQIAQYQRSHKTTIELTSEALADFEENLDEKNETKRRELVLERKKKINQRLEEMGLLEDSTKLRWVWRNIDIERYEAAAREVSMIYNETLPLFADNGIYVKPMANTFGVVTAELSIRDIEKLANLSIVGRIDVNGALALQLSTSVPTIKANNVWPYYDGVAGENVIIVDSGVDFTHPALQSRKYGATSKIDSNPDDLNGHGTLLAGIVASTDATYKGVSPGLQLISAKVTNDGSVAEGTVIDATDWALGAGGGGTGVILLWGFGCGSSCSSDASSTLSMYADWITYYYGNRILVVAGGNNGAGSGTVYNPADAYNVISVGAMDSKNDANRGNDVIWSFSSRGPASNGRIKPEIVAPGVTITSTNYNHETENDFTLGTGTSVAAAHVAGTSGLIVDALEDKGLGVNSLWVKSLLLLGAEDLGISGPDNTYGAGYLDAWNSVEPIINSNNNMIRAGKVIRKGITFYRVNANQGEEVRVALAWNRRVGRPYGSGSYDFSQLYPPSDLDLWVEDPNGYTVAYSDTGSNWELVKFTAPVTGTYIIEVFGDDIQTPDGWENYGIVANVPEASLQPSPNNDGDDLTDAQENALAKVCDKFGLTNTCFPDPNKKDAFFPVTAAEKFYYNHPYFKYYNFESNFKSRETSGLAYHLLLLTELHKQTTNSSLKSELEPRIKNFTDEIIRRQNTESFIWRNKTDIGRNILNLKGYIAELNSNSYNRDYFQQKFDYTAPDIPTATSAMALLNAGDELNNSHYLDRGRLATDFVIRWLEVHNFNDDVGDPYARYPNSSWPEAINKGGDEFMSTANHYGMPLMAVSHAEGILKGNYTKQVGISAFPEGTYDYSDISKWMIEEVRALQDNKTGVNYGAIRTGPLDSSLSDRLNEHIWYEGLTSMGVRQYYDMTRDNDAFQIVKDMAGHYWNIYNASNESNWWPIWSIDESKPVNCEVSSGVKAWASIIELNGKYTYGFRQAVFDGGGADKFTGDTMFLLTLYEAMKLKSDPEVVFPWEIVFSENHESTYTECPDLGLIYQGEKKTTSFNTIDTFDKAFIASLSYPGSNLTIVLYNPNGTKIDPSVASSDPNIDYFENQTLKYYTVRYPEFGGWTAEVEAVEAPTEGEPYDLKTIYYTALSLNTYAEDDYYEKDSPAKIHALLLNDTVGMTASVSANIGRPDGTIYNIQLFDDGTHSDFIASDGEYTNTFYGTYVGGEYTINTFATGTVDGKTFSRSATDTFYVSDVGGFSSGFLTSMIYRGNHSREGTVTAIIYAENDGDITIDDEIVFTITDPTGKTVHDEWIPIYLEPGEDTFLWFDWEIPENEPPGIHWFEVSFDDLDIDFLPSHDSFEVT